MSNLSSEQITYPFQGRPGARIEHGDYRVLKAGEWGRYRSSWFGCTPNGMFCDLTNHAVTEHEDGTITCSPSIEVKGEGYWHGFLEHGVWRLA